MKDVLQKLVGSINKHESYNIVLMLSKYHRVQGSEALIDAAEQLMEHAQSAGLEADLRVVEGCLGLDREWFFWEPSGWSFEYARVEVREASRWREVVSTNTHPLVLVVHSPPGIGEGIAKATRKGKSVNVPILLNAKSYDYWSFVDEAEAIIFTHAGPGIRYYGLYPPCNKASLAKIPAVSIEFSNAMRINDERVRVEVSSRYTTLRTPIIHLRIGEGTLRILVLAHLCHPMPGAHDNASGVAAALTLAKMLKGFENLLKDKGVQVDILLTPEYTGPAYALTRILDVKGIVAAISLDMVGANLSITGSALVHYPSMPSIPSPLDPYLYAALWDIFSEEGFELAKYPREPLHLAIYEPGSDHDVALSLGIPASMINEWPDKYYHTSLDEPKNIDPDRLLRISAAVASAVIAFAKNIENMDKVLAVWRDFVRSEQVLKNGLDLSRVDIYSSLLDKGVKHALSIIGDAIGKSIGESWQIDLKLKRRGTISTLWLKMKDDYAARKLLELDEKTRTMYTNIAALTLSATRSIEAAKLTIQAYGLKPNNELLELIKRYLEE